MVGRVPRWVADGRVSGWVEAELVSDGAGVACGVGVVVAYGVLVGVYPSWGDDPGQVVVDL